MCGRIGVEYHHSLTQKNEIEGGFEVWDEMIDDWMGWENAFFLAFQLSVYYPWNCVILTDIDTLLTCCTLTS